MNLTPPRRLVNLYIVTAHVSLAGAFFLTAWHPAAVAGFFYHARIVAVVHLVTIGWIALSILGMAYVVLPFACGVALPARRGDYAIFALILIGLIGMVAHFWIGEFGGMAWSAAAAATGILHAVTRLAFAMRRSKVAHGVKVHLYLAALNAAGAVAMGVLLGFDKVRSFLPGYVLSNVFAHAHLAAVGWVSMTMMGFGYRLLPMVLPSAMPSGRSLYASAIGLEIGVVGLFASLVMRSGTTLLFTLLILGAIASFAVHVMWMLAHPRRPPPGRGRRDFAVHHLAAAGMCLVLASVCGLFLAALPMSDATMRLALLYGVLGLVGFLAQAIVGFERRILPVAWNYWAVQKTGRTLGPPQRRVPPVLTFLAWSGGVPLLAGGFFINSTGLLATGAWLLVAASLLMLIDVVNPMGKISTSAEISDTMERPNRIVPFLRRSASGTQVACRLRTMTIRNLFLSILMLVCGAAAARAESLQPAGWDASLKLPEAQDINPDPKIVEINLEARLASLEIVPGVKTEVWTYNGGVPGPLIRVRRGDRLIVHFSNKLDKSTTVHWHGVQVPIEMDGVPGVSQPPVEPGSSFIYDFVLPDAGLFWYHPHVMSAAQVGAGLYGPLLVDDPDDPVKVDDQLVMVLSDIAVEESSGELQSPDSGGVLGALFGREGNHVLVNGRIRPTVPMRSGAMQRWRIVNTAKSRYFQLQFDDPQQFMLIGVDGGHMEYSLEQPVIVLAPGERADVLVAPVLKDGKGLTLINVPYDRGFGSVEFRSADDLITFSPASLPPVTPGAFPNIKRDIQPMSADGATRVDIELILSKEHGVANFDIKGGPFWKGTSVAADIGDKQLWTITNKAIWAHPIHLHGFFFQEVDEKGVPVKPLAWKDTIHVPAESTRRFLVKLDRPGSWMYHCHILDHAEAGLMSTVDVGVADDSSASHHQH